MENDPARVVPAGDAAEQLRLRLPSVDEYGGAVHQFDYQVDHRFSASALSKPHAAGGRADARRQSSSVAPPGAPPATRPAARSPVRARTPDRIAPPSLRRRILPRSHIDVLPRSPRSNLVRKTSGKRESSVVLCRTLSRSGGHDSADLRCGPRTGATSSNAALLSIGRSTARGRPTRYGCRVTRHSMQIRFSGPTELSA